MSITEQKGDADYLRLHTVLQMAEKEGFKYIQSYEGELNYT